MELSEKSEKIANLKYYRKDEDWTKMVWRVSEYIGSAEKDDETRFEYAKKFFQLIYNQVFLPGGRILANSGTGIKSLMNCFTLPLNDSREGIYQTLKESAEIFAHGGGVGYNFSNIREEGAPIKTTSGIASGPLSFLQLFDTTGEVISQASRRGAQLAVLNIDHPDVEKFINYKSTPNTKNRRLLTEYKRNLRHAGLKDDGHEFFKVLEKTLQDDQLSHFNISVGITDKFMLALTKGEKFQIVPRGALSPKDVSPKKLLRQIAEMAWESGDPGILFLDRINEDNMVPYIGEIQSTNPCITGDTKILTVYEGAKPIKELAEKGEDILVYAWNPKNKLPVVRMMRNPRLTRKDSEIVEVSFDSGLKIKCTPDHKFFAFRGEQIQAQDLQVGQSVRAYSVELHKDGHLRVLGYSEGKVKHQYVSRLVWECFEGKIPPKIILHHRDLDKLNNKYENMELLSNSQHTRLHHSAQGHNHKVTQIKYLSEREDVYNGTVDDVHSYIIPDDNPITGIYSGIVSANCSAYGTLVSTKNGLIPVEKINTGDIISTINGEGVVKSTEHHKNLPVYKVTLSDGAEIVVTESHQFFASKNKIDFDFIPLKSLSIGDSIAISELSIPNNKLDTGILNERDFGFLVGCFIGDGCYTPGIIKKGSMAISVSQDTPDWNSIVLDILQKFGFKHIKENKSKLERSMAYFVRGDEIKEFLSLSKLSPISSTNKYIPIELINSNKNILGGIIDGLISTDGNINLSGRKHMIRLKTASKQLAKDLRIILLMFGIHARIYSYFRKEHKIGNREISNKNPYYEVLILSSEAMKFKNTFSITHPDKKYKLNILNTTGKDSWSSKIKAIEPYGNADVCDIFEPESDTWIVGGIVNRGCGEVPLLPYEACDLGSLNLLSFYDKESKKINYEFLEYAVRLSVRFLDNVQTISEIPIEKINNMSKNLRRLGLGVMGFADLLAEMEIPYNSSEGQKLGNYLAWFISFFGWLESMVLSEEKGIFNFYEEDKVDLKHLEQVLNSKYNTNPVNMEEVRKHGVRNLAVTAIAPTGSLALLCDVNSGIEPFFALAYKRNITEGIGNTAKDFIIEVNPILMRKLEELNLDEETLEKIKEKILKTGSVQGIKEIPDRLKNVFLTANELTPEAHLEMQSQWQQYVDNSISKTVNVNKDATVEDIEEVIIKAWNKNLKGVTLFRDQSKSFQILNAGVK